MSFVCLSAHFNPVELKEGSECQRKEIAFREISIPCLDVLKAEKSYVVNEESEYRSLRSLQLSFAGCDIDELPEVDFSKETVVGYVTFSEGCSKPDFTRSIFFLDGNYTVSVSVHTHGICRKAFYIFHWFLLDKIADRSKIKFETVYRTQP